MERAADLLPPSVVSAARASARIAGVDLPELPRLEASGLDSVTSAYAKLVRLSLASRAPGEPWPVLVIDGAEALGDDTAWGGEGAGAAASRSLLRFFEEISADAGAAHGATPPDISLAARCCCL